MSALGQHLLIDYYECDPKVIDDINLVKEHLVAAAKLANATIVQEVFHRFAPQGVSGVVVIAESHIAIHTWPEFKTAAVDAFTCGSEMKTEVICDYLKKAFKAENYKVTKVDRG